MAQTTITTTTEGGVSSFLDSRGFSVFLLIVMIIILGFIIANAVYFNRLRTDQTETSVKRADANTMMWINIVLAILLGFFIFYYAWKVFAGPAYVKVVQQEALKQADVLYAKATAALEPSTQVYLPPSGGQPVYVNWTGPGEYEAGGVKYTCGSSGLCQPKVAPIQIQQPTVVAAPEGRAVTVQYQASPAVELQPLQPRVVVQQPQQMFVQQPPLYQQTQQPVAKYTVEASPPQVNVVRQ